MKGIFVFFILFCFVIGFSDVDGEVRNEQKPYWQELSTLQSPLERYFHAVAYDPIRKRTVLFGGAHEDAGDPLSDTWEFDGTNWYQVSTTIKPSKRWKAAMAFDHRRMKIVLFGGEQQGGSSIIIFDDTWEFDGNSWTEVVTNNKPEKRLSHCLSFDHRLNGLVLFGGSNSSTTNPFPDTTWLYSGGDWQKLIYSNKLSGRAGGKMVFDTQNNRTILFGGHAGIVDYDTTWTLTKKGWSQIETFSSPGGISFFGMAYEDVNQKIVLFGGGGLGEYRDRTFEFDGFDWQEVSHTSKPCERIATDMVFDEEKNRIILFGGTKPFGLGRLNDTWEYVLVENTQLPTLNIISLTILLLLFSMIFSAIILKKKVWSNNQSVPGYVKTENRRSVYESRSSRD